MPRVVDCGGDLSRRWYIVFSIRDEVTGQMLRFKKYNGINFFQTSEERYAKANQMVALYTERLLRGWNPFENESVVYQDALEYRLVAQKYGELKRGTFPLRKYAAEYISQFDKHRFSTYQQYQSKLRIFTKWLQQSGNEKIQSAMFDEALAEKFFTYLDTRRNVSNKTHNQYRTLLIRFFKFLLKKKIVRQNPIVSIEVRRVDKKIAKYYSENMVARVREHIIKHDLQLWMSVKLQYYCYVRPKEMRFLQLKDIDLWGGYINIQSEISKNHHERKLTIPKPFWDELNAMNIDQYPSDYYLFGIKNKPSAQHVGKNFFNVRYQKIKEALQRSIPPS